MIVNEKIFLSRAEIIDKINQFSGLNKPFLFAIDFSGKTGFVLSPEEAHHQGIRFETGGGGNGSQKRIGKPLRFDYFPIDFPAYKKAFEKVTWHLKRGDTYLLNLTFQTPLKVNLSLEEVFTYSRAPFKLYVPGHFTVFSPEIFVHISHGRIYSCPMKGTIDADLPDAEARLLADEKEFFEHNTIVDLIRNDLSMVSTDVKVTRFRYIDRITTHRGELLQASSEISGRLDERYKSRLGDLLFTLCPAGSVTGAPKEKTVEIIRAVENYDRGFYTGIFGYSDGDSLTSAVSIRFIEQGEHGLMFKSGGGITALSEMESEYNEMLKKIYVPVI